MRTADIAVIGGSGFYTFLEGPETIEIDTPYGKPSAPLAIGSVATDAGGVDVAFLPRHGSGHEFPAHTVPYRANMWALRSVGVQQILAPCAVGGLQPEYGPGTFLVPDQLVDRTFHRQQTYFDSGACHISFADPYCERLRTGLLGALNPLEPVDGGTMVVIEGPRFSTRAESRHYGEQGWSVVNMTGHPEAVLARELGLCYAAVALVTDHDAGVDAVGAVSQAAVFEVFAQHTESLRETLRDGIGGFAGAKRDCACPEATAGMSLPIELPSPGTVGSGPVGFRAVGPETT